MGARVREPFSIICLSPQDWHEALPTNRQQVMLRAARRGHHVLFVETGHFFGKHVWALIFRSSRRSLMRRMFSTQQASHGVLVRKAFNILPWGSRYWLPKKVNSALTARQLRRLGARLPQPLVLWVYDAGAACLVGTCSEEFAVYDCVDDYVEQAAGQRKRELISKCDRIVAFTSKLVFTTSTVMYERQRRRNSATHLVPNAGDYEHFVRAADRSTSASELLNLQRPVLGFAGNFIPSKIDFDLLEDVVRNLSHCTFLLIGPVTKAAAPVLQRIAQMPHVWWLGPKPYSDLPHYVAAFDVALIPYVSNAYTRSCFPLKTYEYLAAGKPVVASGLPELADMKPDVILTDDAPTFVQAVQEALNRNTEADQARRRRLAAHNTWETRTERLLELVRQELEKSRRAA